MYESVKRNSKFHGLQIWQGCSALLQIPICKNYLLAFQTNEKRSALCITLFKKHRKKNYF